MDLIVHVGGAVRCIYGESINLATLGRLRITRASRVEPDASGHWYADMSPVGGPALGPFGKRSEALAAESAWLRDRLT